MNPLFKPGKNIALKIPSRDYQETVAFYRDVLQLPELGESQDGALGFDFDGKFLWLDNVANLTEAEIWLQIETSDTTAAAEHFHKYQINRCDEIETLPPGFDGFWIKNPASLVHLVSKS